MKIIIKSEVMARLLCYAVATPNEFSGFGFCERQDGNIYMYDFVLVDVGTYGYTETDPKRMLPLFERPDRKNMKVWLHKHPVGSGTPGPHNWSGRDVQTILREPLGSTPQDVGWSVSIVLTPGGFVGRIDNYLKGITQHLEVEPKTADFFAELRSFERQSFPPHTTHRRGTKLPDYPPADFQAMETPKRKKRNVLIGVKTPKNGKKSKAKTRMTAALSFLKRCVTCVRTTILRLRPSRIFARNTASIGPGNTASATGATNTGCGGSHS